MKAATAAVAVAAAAAAANAVMQPGTDSRLRLFCCVMLNWSETCLAAALKSRNLIINASFVPPNKRALALSSCLVVPSFH
jgi:hypothetical protein